jgi:hypothetical protein
MLAVYLLHAALYAAAPDAAGPFDFPEFRLHQNLNVVGAARYAGSVLRLTDARLNTSGAAWYPSKEPVASGFDTEFQFQLTEPGGLGSGADGLAFVLQSSGASALAGRGSAGGWGLGDGHRDRRSPGIPRAIAIFFDTFQNSEDHDPSDNYIGIFNNGRPDKMHWPARRLAYTPDLRVTLKDGNVHTARILYRPPLLSIYLDDPATPVLVAAADIGLVTDQSGFAWVGFTASTGSGYENHDILSWSFHSADVSSAMVSSNISFFMDKCLPGRNLCTPDRAIVEPIQPGRFHIVLPANLEWGASVANPSGREVAIDNPRGTVCWDLKGRGATGCSGPDGSPHIAGTLDKDKPAGALIVKTEKGRTWFSVNDTAFDDNEGYFEFEVAISP